MKITFFSSVLGYHQESLCKAFYNELGDNFKFVAYSQLPKMRKELGFEELNDKYSFVVKAYEPDGKMEADKLMKTSDIAIIGAAPNYVIDYCVNNDIQTFLFSERFFKKGTWRRFYPPTYKKVYDRTIKFNKKLSILSASAYLPYDLKICGFKGEIYQWGYFPNVKKHNLNKLMENKSNTHEPTLLWAGRFIEWKHPEKPILVAEKLKSENIKFKLKMIGCGPLVSHIEDLIKKKNLEDVVELLGVVPPNEVRLYMEKSDIYLFTSDYNEGWGVVLNESMNSGCAVVASHAIGSVPYIINNYKNGIIYNNNDFDTLYTSTKYLIENEVERKRIAISAYETMVQSYSPELAVKRFINMISNSDQVFENGVCSKPAIIKQNRMYQYIKG